MHIVAKLKRMSHLKPNVQCGCAAINIGAETRLKPCSRSLLHFCAEQRSCPTTHTRSHFVWTHLCYDGSRAVLDLVLNPIMHPTCEFYSHESHKTAAGCHQRKVDVRKRFQGCKCCNFSSRHDGIARKVCKRQ